MVSSANPPAHQLSFRVSRLGHSLGKAFVAGQQRQRGLQLADLCVNGLVLKKLFGVDLYAFLRW